MKQLKTFSVSELKKEISSKFKSLSGLKNHLKETAVYQYGGHFNEISVYGCKISYNDNPNCFANYIINIPQVGNIAQYGLGKSSITKAGKIRLGSTIKNHYINL
jgi:hypothetical protein